MTALFPLMTLLQGRNDEAAAAAAGLVAFGCIFWVILMVALVAFPIFCFWRIFTKTGQNGALALLCLVPVVGMIIVLCILAFGEWPIHRDRQ